MDCCSFISDLLNILKRHINQLHDIDNQQMRWKLSHFSRIDYSLESVPATTLRCFPSFQFVYCLDSLSMEYQIPPY